LQTRKTNKQISSWKLAFFLQNQKNQQTTFKLKVEHCSNPLPYLLAAPGHKLVLPPETRELDDKELTQTEPVTSAPHTTLLIKEHMRRDPLALH
jgi:hypothetical protein